MADLEPKRFHFYRRYKWNEFDFADFQEMLIGLDRGFQQAQFQGAVLDGLNVTPVANLTLSVSDGMACGPTGDFLGYDNVGDTITLVAPTTHPRKSLIVLRPLLTDSDDITNPVSPFEQVPLKQIMGAQLAVVNGTESETPAYPAKAANDVVLAGVKLIPSQSSVGAEDFDFEVREIPGRNATQTGKHIFRYDNRLRPYRSDFRTLGVMPAQTGDSGEGPRTFIDPGKGKPSIFPKDVSGFFNAADTFLNFGTGAITGGDAISADFTPTVPTAGNSIVATVTLSNTDTLAVAYGTQGTLAQCVAGIKSQITSGAGSIAAAQGQYKIAYVIVSSRSGAISDIRVFDARAMGGGGSGSGGSIQLQWFAPDNLPAQEGWSGFVPVMSFWYQSGAGQTMSALMKVPDNYSTGQLITLKGMQFSTTVNAGKVAMKTTSYLIRPGTDTTDGPALSNNSTNAAVTVSATAKRLNNVGAIDITDSTGKIGGTNPSPGDLILVSLFRDQTGEAGGAGSAAANADVVKYGAEIAIA